MGIEYIIIVGQRTDKRINDAVEWIFTKHEGKMPFADFERELKNALNYSYSPIQRLEKETIDKAGFEKIGKYFNGKLYMVKDLVIYKNPD